MLVVRAESTSQGDHKRRKCISHHNVSQSQHGIMRADISAALPPLKVS